MPVMDGLESSSKWRAYELEKRKFDPSYVPLIIIGKNFIYELIPTVC